MKYIQLTTKKCRLCNFTIGPGDYFCTYDGEDFCSEDCIKEYEFERIEDQIEFCHINSKEEEKYAKAQYLSDMED